VHVKLFRGLVECMQLDYFLKGKKNGENICDSPLKPD